VRPRKAAVNWLERSNFEQTALKIRATDWKLDFPVAPPRVGEVHEPRQGNQQLPRCFNRGADRLRMTCRSARDPASLRCGVVVRRQTDHDGAGIAKS
jgi:hypothetical protein